MSSSTIPYCAVEERKIRDMPVPYEKLDEIIKNSRDIIISKQHRKNKTRNFLVCGGVCGFMLVVFAMHIIMGKQRG